MKALIVLVALTSCAPTSRYALKRCPTTTALLGDFALSTVAFATSALAYNAGNYARSVTFATVGLGLSLADNLSECRK